MDKHVVLMEQSLEQLEIVDAHVPMDILEATVTNVLLD